MASTCSHALMYQNSDASNEEIINVINPAVMKFNDEGKCQFYIEPRKIIVAHGMLKSTGRMPHDIYKKFSSLIQQRWNHTDYFDRRAGRKPMMPQHQRDVISIANELGYTFPDSPWDTTIEEIQYFY